jgi:hypothetical protein
MPANQNGGPEGPPFREGSNGYSYAAVRFFCWR